MRTIEWVGEITVTEIQLVKKQLAEAKAEIADLRLRLSNSSMLLKIEMTESGKLPKFDQEVRRRDCSRN